MQFERTVFRFHKSCLMNPVVKYMIIFGSSLLVMFLLFTSYNLYIVHSEFVNKNTILSQAISVQLKTMMHREYHWLYTETGNLAKLGEALRKADSFSDEG